MPKLFFIHTSLLILLFLILHLLINAHQAHPILMILMILFNTLLVCILMSLWQSNPMYSILLFLIMISGLLIIFLYFSSLITNMQNKLSINFLMLISFMINLILFFYLKFINFNYNSPLYLFLETQFTPTFNQEMFKNLFMIYSYPYNNFTFLCMFFLLVAMFIIIKMCTIKSSPLRKIS